MPSQPRPETGLPRQFRADQPGRTDWPRGRGELSTRIREFDWATTPLGPLPQWPQSLRTLVDLLIASPSPAYIAWGPQLTSIYNDAYAQLLGSKHPPGLGQAFETLFAEVRDVLMPLVQATLGGQSQHYEDRPLALTGQPETPRRWFTFSWTPLRDDSGSVAGFYGTATETTQKVLAQEALREAQRRSLQASERRYQTLFESIDEGFSVLEVLFDKLDRPVDYRFQEVNPAFERQTGIVNGQGRTARELVPDLEQKWFDIYGDVARTGTPTRFVEHAKAMGRWFDVYAFRLGQPHEKLVAVRFNDITPRREAEERQKAIFQIQTVGVMFWGKGFGLTAMNDAFLRMTGFTRDEAMGKTWQELTPAEFHPESWHAVNEVTTKGETTPYEKQYFRKDGSRWWGLFAARRIGDEVVEFVLDVTQRREAETALRAADERKDVFLATLAHELRNPLAPLLNGLQIARLGGLGDDPRTRRTIDMMERQLTHLVRLVDDLMDVGRIAAGKLELKREPVQLANVLAASVEAVRDAIERHGHRLEVQAPAQSLAVLGDFERLAQVFVNLLTNAAKYTQRQGLIQLTLSREGEHAVVQVEDNGIGIPAEEAERVFDLFSQVREHQERTEGGLGIGLALVKRVVTSHGGEVYAYSAGPGCGSRFTVSLPLMHQQPTPSAVAPPRTINSGATARRVLVADDNEDAAGSLAELLRIGGHDVRTAHDGREAVQVVQAFAPDIVILDLGMPHVDGFEAARRIRSLEQGKHVTMVALSGWGQDTDRARSRAAGFDHHFTKPATVATLEAILRPPV